MVDFQSRDTRRGVSDEDEEAVDADDGVEDPSNDEPSVDDDIEVEEVVDEPPSPAAESSDGEQTSPDGEPPDDDPGSSDMGISAADQTSADERASGTDPLSTEVDTADESPSADAGSPDDDAAAVDDPPGAASSGIDRIGDAPDPTAGSKPDTGDPASAEPAETEHAVMEPADAATEPAESAESQPTTPSRTVAIALLTVGGTPSAERLETAIESTGHDVVVSEHVEGGYDEIQQAVDELVALPAVDGVVTAGGIGITPDERTIEAVHPLLEKALPGFGEAFRRLLFDQIGTGIVAVRSTAGIADGTLVFCLPGDAAAARLAIEEIVATEAPELVAHLAE